MLLAAIALASMQAPVLDDASYLKIRDLVRPSASETKWREIPWQPDLWSAAVKAHRESKPILLWAMNGHPLACT